MDSLSTLPLASETPLAPTRRGWRTWLARIAPFEAVKYVIVGFSGIGVNLGAMAVILHQTSMRDWRASLVASIVSTMNNYVLNNFWTFRGRGHSGMTFIRRYVVYLGVSLIGLAVTTVVYAVTSRELAGRLQKQELIAALPVSALLLCQLVAILLGTLFNYLLNRSVTWPHPSREN